MALFSSETGYTGSPSIRGSFLVPVASLFQGFASRWRAFRDLQSLDHVPFEVMKDVGFPGAERMNDK
jgi:hypothetical protein